jgi:predicted phosphodiesterase
VFERVRYRSGARRATRRAAATALDLRRITMRLAALYDIHGNLPALEAVLDAIEALRVDAIVIGGDVLPGPFARETLDRLRSLSFPTYFLRGNGEREVLALRSGGDGAAIPAAHRASMRWVADSLTHAQVQWIEQWPPTITMNVPSLGNVLFCHATPHSDTELFTSASSDESIIPLFRGVTAGCVVCGHTHMQFDRQLVVDQPLRLVNAGSAGMPFGAPGAYWLLMHEGEIELRHTGYDLARAAERIRATAYPDRVAFAEQHVLAPPSEAAMLQALTPRIA